MSMPAASKVTREETFNVGDRVLANCRFTGGEFVFPGRVVNFFSAPRPTILVRIDPDHADDDPIYILLKPSQLQKEKTV
jgi:hypothetical protein